jgi:hypothetical protein
MRKLFVVMFLLAILAPAAAHAQTYQGARPLALGDAYRAAATGNEAIFYNPSGMSFYLQRYNLDLGWTYNPEGALHYFNGSIVDSLSSPPLGAGFAFTYFLGDTVAPKPTTKLKGYRLDLAISHPFARVLLWGVDLKFVNLDINTRESAIYAVTGDMGVTWIISKWVRAAATGHNLVPIGRPEFPIQSGFGIALGRETGFQFTVDTVINYLSKDDIAGQYMGGLEFMAGEMFALRVGYTYDQVRDDTQYVSAGLGIIAPRMGLDFGFRQNLSMTDDRFFSLVLRIFAG